MHALPLLRTTHDKTFKIMMAVGTTTARHASRLLRAHRADSSPPQICTIHIILFVIKLHSVWKVQTQISAARLVILFWPASSPDVPPVGEVVGVRHSDILTEAVVLEVELRDALLHALHEVVQETQAVLVRLFAVLDAGKRHRPVVEEPADVFRRVGRSRARGARDHLADEVRREGRNVLGMVALRRDDQIELTVWLGSTHEVGRDVVDRQWAARDHAREVHSGGNCGHSAFSWYHEMQTHWLR